MESPGTAPGSEPFIMGAFIAIVRVTQDMFNIGAGFAAHKGACKISRQGCCFGDGLSQPLVRRAVLGALMPDYAITIAGNCQWQIKAAQVLVKPLAQPRWQTGDKI